MNLNNLKQIKNEYKTNNYLKILIYLGLGILGLYVIGKLFSALAFSTRGFNDFRSALKGN